MSAGPRGPAAPTLALVEILLWLVPSGVVTVLAMLWVGWLGRERPPVDRDEAVSRMGRARSRDLPAPVRRRPPAPPRDRSTGVAVRPSRAP